MFLQDRQRLFGQAASRIVLGRLLPIFFDVFLMILHHRLREGPVEGSTGKNLELGIGRFCTDARTRRRGHPKFAGHLLGFASAPVAANAPASATATIAVVLLIIAPKVPFACVVYGEASAIKTAGVQSLFLVGLLEHISASIGRSPRQSVFR